MAFHVEKVKRALWRQHFVDQEQHVTFWWDCGKKTVQHNSNFVQLHAYESISESDSAFCGFLMGGARSTTLIATEHFVDPKNDCTALAGLIRSYIFGALEKNNQLFTRLSRFFSSFGGSHVKERKSKVNGFTYYYREPTNGCTKRHMLIDSRFFPMHYFFA